MLLVWPLYRHRQQCMHVQLRHTVSVKLGSYEMDIDEIHYGVPHTLRSELQKRLSLVLVRTRFQHESISFV